MTVDKVIAKIIWLTFFGPPCMSTIKLLVSFTEWHFAEAFW